MTTMTSKFAGTCKSCGNRFEAGTVIRWSRELGAHHAGSCPAKSVAAGLASIAAKNAAISCNRCGGNCHGIASCDANIEARKAREAASGAQKPIADFIGAARARGLKFPKVRFLAPDGKGEIMLSVAGNKSKAPGSIQVKLNGEWIGRIEPTGAVVGRALSGDASMLATLSAIASDPAGKAKAYGALNGNCSFCGKKLSAEGDGSSVEVGYGPSCAKKFGLPHKAGRSRKLAKTVDAASFETVNDAPLPSEWMATA